ncbi:MAG: type I-B CRISPR-associated endonuclease Cas1b [bacterium]
MRKTVYLFSDGELSRKDDTLAFKTAEGRRFIPVEDTGEIMIYGEVNFNKRLLELLAKKEIILHYFNYYGYYTGSFYPREHLNSGYMILKQSEHYLDETKRYRIALELLTGAGKNIRQVMKYYISRGKPLEESLKSIEKLLDSMSASKGISALMALEGKIRDYYYQVFDDIIDNEGFIFDKRTRRPPQNTLNTLISFGNSLMYTICLSEIYNTHLDPRIGYLHTTNFRRFSLNLDLAEIFKPVIIDRLIFSLLGRKMISAKDFEQASQGIMMKEKAKKTFVAELDAKLKATINHRPIGRSVSYRRLIRLEAYKLEKHLMGEKDYKAFVAQW